MDRWTTKKIPLETENEYAQNIYQEDSRSIYDHQFF